jgi:hypothetical protein
MMKKTVATGLAMFFSLALVMACQLTFGAQGAGSGNIVSQKRQVSGFDRVSLDGSGELTIVTGEEESLVVEGDDNLIERVKSEVRDGTLYISLEPGSLSNVQPSNPFKYQATVKALSGVELTGAGAIDIDRVDTDTFDLQSSGAGNVRIHNIQASLLAILMDGAGGCEIEAGTVERQKLEINGLGSYTAPNLESKTADVQISGAGGATLWVSDSLDVVISGSGKVSYYGSPQLQFENTGAGSVEALGDK